MKLTIKKKIGKNIYPFTFDGDNLHDVIMKSNDLSFGDVHKCGECGDDNLILSAHVAQGKYKYTEIRCLKCRATVTFGKREDNDNVFFLRKNDDKSLAWKKFEPKDNQGKDYGKSLNEQKGDFPW